MQLSVQVGTRRSAHHTRNEDRAVMGGHVFGDVPEIRTELIPGPTLVAVLDGLGGHQAGEVASEIAGRRLAGAEIPTDEASTCELLLRTDVELHEAAMENPGYAGMGTTAALVVVGANGADAMVANVGDSTVWRLDDEGLVELTSSDRAFGSTILQCLGANRVGVEPHVRRIELATGDRILLASDGLTDVVSAQDIADTLLGDPDHGVQQLFERVNAAGPPDDVTIVFLGVVDG